MESDKKIKEKNREYYKKSDKRDKENYWKEIIRENKRIRKIRK
jgi:hypothetical protein